MQVLDRLQVAATAGITPLHPATRLFHSRMDTKVDTRRLREGVPVRFLLRPQRDPAAQRTRRSAFRGREPSARNAPTHRRFNSIVGCRRPSVSQSAGQGFESPHLHHSERLIGPNPRSSRGLARSTCLASVQIGAEKCGPAENDGTSWAHLQRCSAPADRRSPSGVPPKDTALLTLRGHAFLASRSCQAMIVFMGAGWRAEAGVTGSGVVDARVPLYVRSRGRRTVGGVDARRAGRKMKVRLQVDGARPPVLDQHLRRPLTWALQSARRPV